MLCPKCHRDETVVIDSRETDEGVRRRRECEHCALRFTTHERVEIPRFTIIKKNGKEESYQRDKIKQSLVLASNKRPVTEEQIERVIDRIEIGLVGLNKNKIPTREIGERVIKELKKLDKVAYLRFASVYKDFQEVDRFAEELSKLSSK